MLNIFKGFYLFSKSQLSLKWSLFACFPCLCPDKSVALHAVKLSTMETVILTSKCKYGMYSGNNLDDQTTYFFIVYIQKNKPWGKIESGKNTLILLQKKPTSLNLENRFTGVKQNCICLNNSVFMILHYFSF